MSNWTMRVSSSLVTKAKAAAESQDYELSEFTRQCWRRLIRKSEKRKVIPEATKKVTSDKKKLSEEVGSKTSSERTISLSEPSEEALVLSRSLVVFIMKNNWKHKPIEESTIKRWGRVADLMHHRDNRPWKDMAALLEWCQRDTFWMKNILSMEKFREKYDQLAIKAPNVWPIRYVEKPKVTENPAWYRQHQMQPITAGDWDGGVGCVCDACENFRVECVERRRVEEANREATQ